ncbi:transposable element Tc1 transposase [Trichonephila clavipes]|uniref:Transposable element Tc1 transposase n=1 Tax=Trichonephila clavipes TaxID=2585209 RepID=A0A8X6UTC9_TRICX|nr:transposable element Tc1 transposase [Trichonephila clavipes]
MDFTEINSRGKRGELLGRIDKQNSRFRTAKTIIINVDLHASFVESESAKNALNQRVKFEQISVFERGRIVGLREAGLSYRAVAARVQRNSSTIMRVSKQWTDEGRTARKSESGPRNVTSAREDRRLVRMA